jgi:sialic acid synthase SpsE
MSKIASIDLGGRAVGPGAPVLVIAEIGINHEGDSAVCLRMTEAAARAGADAVKLQTIDPEANYVRGTESHAVFSRGQLGKDGTARCFEAARKLGLLAFTTAGDFATLAWVDALEPAAHKISSGLLTNLPMIRAAAKTGRPLLMSTGMAEPADIDAAMQAAADTGARGVGLFQCTSIYPAPDDLLNLSAIRWMEKRYAVPVGFSDHSPGTDAAGYAVAAGARFIEKHFTLDKSRPGFDHHISLEPDAFTEMVRGVRRAEAMLGPGEKIMAPAEREARAKFHRCLVAIQPVKAGEPFTAANLGLKRPLPGRSGLPPSFYEQVVGRRAARDLKPDDTVAADAVEGLS